MKLLFDASAFLNLIKILGKDSFTYLKGNYILSLTPYEICNAIWKEAVLLRRISIDEALALIDYINKTYELLNIINPTEHSLILKVAYTIKITYYDSSYIVSATRKNLILVTDDNRLKRKINTYQQELHKILHKKVELFTTRDLLKT